MRLDCLNLCSHYYEFLTHRTQNAGKILLTIFSLLISFQHAVEGEVVEHIFTLPMLATPTATTMPVSAASAAFNGTWPRNVKLELPGDVTLGALMMIHERANEPLVCGELMAQGGFQALEAFLYTLEYVNRHGIIPHTRLGALVLDDCDKDTYGLQQAVHFIKGSMSSLDDEEEQQSECLCAGSGDGLESEQSQQNFINRQKSQVITGVVAASSSVTSIQVANLLKLFKIPQVSYFSTSPELANQERFNYFFRTIPSDEYQVNAMVEIITQFNWTYVSVVYEESSYGKVAFSKLEEKLAERNVCIAVREKLPKDSDVAHHAKYVQIVRNLRDKNKARAVVVYGSDQEVRGLMRAVKSEKVTGMFTFIGSDGWSSRALVYAPAADDMEGLEKQVLGTISVQPMAQPVKGFEEYFATLKVHSSRDQANPWLYEFWEKEFNCKYPGYPFTPYNLKYDAFCDGSESIGHKHVFEEQLQFVSDAVFVFAYGLRAMLLSACPDGNSDCIRNQYASEVNEFSSSKRIDGAKLKEFIQNVNFTGLAGTQFQFTDNGGPPRYNIIHYRRNIETGKNEWVNVGNYTSKGLILNFDKIEFSVNISAEESAYASSWNLSAPHPFSRCSSPCEPGNKTVATSLGDKCCWVCVPCQSGYFQANKTHCLKCPSGTKPSQNKTACNDIPEETVHFDSFYSIVCLCVAGFGTAVTIFTLAVFIKHNDTPIVKASGRELSYVILFGLFLCFALTPLMLLRPSDVVCGFQRVICGLCFTIVYAAILTKTNRIARIFKSGKRSIRRPIFISPESQVIICGLITSAQLLLMAVWLYTHPPRAVYIYPTVDDNQFVCREAVEYSYLITYIYPILLCIICTVYAFQTRKIPEAFNESKYIGAAVYTTCIIWLAFVPIYFVVKDNITIRVTSVCISTSLTAIVCQVCLFIPKLYIILLRPERNNRQAMMGPKSTNSSAIGKMLTVNYNSTQQTQNKSDSSIYGSDDAILEPLNKHNRAGSLKLTNTYSCDTITTGTQTSPLFDLSPNGILHKLLSDSQEDVQL